MINILFCGICGRMGHATLNAISYSPAIADKMKISVGVDINADSAGNGFGFPVVKCISECSASDKPDVILDFSHHSVLPKILGYAKANRIPAVICTTGHTPEELELMQSTSAFIPVFYSRNMSVGINLLSYLTEKAASMLGEDFDIEIVEAHHNKKLDAPSGTALMLADAAAKGLEYIPKLTYDRHSERRARDKHEIGIHSIRGGNIVGEHSVIFAGNNEVVTLSHSASSRDVFANGAVRACEFIVGKPAGMYDMNDVISELF